jgi:hypothetical protein
MLQVLYDSPLCCAFPQRSAQGKRQQNRYGIKPRFSAWGFLGHVALDEQPVENPISFREYAINISAPDRL